MGRGSVEVIDDIWTILSWSIGVSLTQSNAVMHATTLSASSQLSLFTNARL
jgi:hypothetical protein